MPLSSEHAVELFTAVGFFVIGVSHIAQPQAWVAWFRKLHEWGHVGVFMEGFQYLTTGSLIVAFHNVWQGLPMVLTIIGWSMLLKATVRFTMPDVGLRVVGSIGPERAWPFRAGGVFAIVLSAFCGYLAFRPPA